MSLATAAAADTVFMSLVFMSGRPASCVAAGVLFFFFFFFAAATNQHNQRKAWKTLFALWKLFSKTYSSRQHSTGLYDNLHLGFGGSVWSVVSSSDFPSCWDLAVKVVALAAADAAIIKYHYYYYYHYNYY